MTTASKGYTLVEMMIVLMILGIITSVTLVSFQPLASAKKAEQFLQQLESDIHYLQQLALSTGTSATIRFHFASNSYELRQYTEPVVRRDYDQSIIIDPGISTSEITYLPTGNIRNPRTIHIYIDNHVYRMVFLLGKGRFYIEQVS
ncbi:competence type IV pilus minor pilin ComGD [Desertibacillus haloalkaliphilus]|uniref:competence type IV pilus minor pilin ComGD n=1 Tax=Desertibacillus haloalkaliphilus TaxID=1328930 RepID=UPI001C25C08A|nr:competence type IV pilus minor pilin ComGD [Desertibacillus haloalkaliphilus]